MKNIINQDQVNRSQNYNDSIIEENFLSASSNLQDDLNAIRTQIKNIIGKTNWYDDPDTNLFELQSSGVNIWSVITTDSGSVKPKKEQDSLFILGGSDINTYITDNVGEEDTIFIENIKKSFITIEADSGPNITAASTNDSFSVVGGFGIDVTATQSGFSFSYSGIDPQKIWYRVEANDGNAIVALSAQDSLSFSGGWGISTRIDPPDTVVYISEEFDGQNSVTWKDLKLTEIPDKSIIYLDQNRCLTGYDKFIYDYNKKSIGIGTDNPLESLHVRGSVLSSISSLDDPTSITQDTDSDTLTFSSTSGKEFVEFDNGIIVSAYSSGFKIHRINENLGSLTELSQTVDADIANSVAAQIIGNKIFIAKDYLKCYDISTPESPSLVFSYDLSAIGPFSSSKSLLIYNGLAIIGDSGAFHVINISDQNNIEYKYTETSSQFDEISGIYNYNNKIYMTSIGTVRSFIVFTGIEESSTLTVLGGYGDSNVSPAFTVVDDNIIPYQASFYGDYAYITVTDLNQVFILDIKNSDNISLAGIIENSTTPFNDPSKTYIFDKYLFIVSLDYLHLYDILINSESPSFVTAKYFNKNHFGPGFVFNNNFYLSNNDDGSLTKYNIRGLDIVAANIGIMKNKELNLSSDLIVGNSLKTNSLHCSGENINIVSNFGSSFKDETNIIGNLNIGSFSTPNDKVVFDGAGIWGGPRRDPKGTSNEVLAIDLTETDSDYADILSLESEADILYVSRGYLLSPLLPSPSYNKTFQTLKKKGWSGELEEIQSLSEGVDPFFSPELYYSLQKVSGNKLYRVFKDVTYTSPAGVFYPSVDSAVFFIKIYDLYNMKASTATYSSPSSLLSLTVENNRLVEDISDFDVQGDLVVFVTTKGRIIFAKTKEYDKQTLDIINIYTVDSSYSFSKVQLDGDYMYVTTSVGYRWAKYNISNIMSPTLVGVLSTETVTESGPTYAIVDDGYLHFLDSTQYGTYAVFSDNISNYSTSKVSQYFTFYDFEEPFKIIVKSNFSFVLSGHSNLENSKITIFQIKSVGNTAPIKIGEINFTEEEDLPVDFALMGNYLYVAFSSKQTIYSYNLGQIFFPTSEIGHVTAQDVLAVQKSTFYNNANVFNNVSVQGSVISSNKEITASRYSGQQFGIAYTTDTIAGYDQSDASLVHSGFSGDVTFFASATYPSQTKISTNYSSKTLSFESDSNAGGYWHVKAGGVYELNFAAGLIPADTEDEPIIVFMSNDSDLDPANAVTLFQKQLAYFSVVEYPKFHSASVTVYLKSDTYVACFLKGLTDPVNLDKGAQFSIVKVG